MAVVYHTTMSVDGFITGRDYDMSWLEGVSAEPNPVVDRILGRIGALLIGHRTYHGGASDSPGAKSPEGRPYGGAIDVPMFVLTRDDPAAAAPGYTFLDGQLTEVVARAQAAAGDRDVAVLGAATARRCLEAGVLDEILVHVAPVLLGDGVRLFDRPGGDRVDLEWIDRGTAGPIANQWLRVRSRTGS
jgi:dihydrofolate reductase